MEKTLKTLFEYQRFQEEPELARLIRETEGRYARRELSDEDVAGVTAAKGPGKGTFPPKMPFPWPPDEPPGGGQ